MVRDPLINQCLRGGLWIDGLRNCRNKQNELIYWKYSADDIIDADDDAYGLCLESRVQCAAVSTYFDPISDPPHQNSTRLDPCKKMAASQGHSPLPASTPPTTRPDEYSCWPHSLESTKLPLRSSIPVASTTDSGFGGREMVWTGTRTAGRRVVVVGNGVRTRFWCGGRGLQIIILFEITYFNENLLLGFAYRSVKNDGLWVVKYGRWVVRSGMLSWSIGQHTPGMNNRLKHNESRRPERSSSRLGHTLRSSQWPGRPFGVTHRFSPSFPSTSSILAANKDKWKNITKG